MRARHAGSRCHVTCTGRLSVPIHRSQPYSLRPYRQYWKPTRLYKPLTSRQELPTSTRSKHRLAYKTYTLVNKRSPFLSFNMVKITNNKTVVLLQYPTGYPEAGVHVGVQHREIDTALNEGDVLVRNLYISLDPCMANCFVHNEKVGIKPPSSLVFLSFIP